MLRGLEHLSSQELWIWGLTAVPAARLSSTTRALSSENDKPARVCFENAAPHPCAVCVEPVPVSMAMAAQTTLTDPEQLLPSARQDWEPNWLSHSGLHGTNPQSLFPSPAQA